MKRKKNKLRTVHSLRKYGKGVFGMFLVLFIISGIYMYGGVFSSRVAVQPTKVEPAFRVGDSEISYFQLEQKAREKLEQLRSMLPFSKIGPDNRLSARIAAADELIYELILLQEARKNRMNPTREEITNRIETDKTRFTGKPSEEKEPSLKTLGEKIVKGDERERAFRRTVAYLYGSYANYLEQVKKEIIREKMDARLTDRAKEKVNQEAEQKAEKAMEKIKAGVPFEEVVKEFSEDPPSIKEKGGVFQEVSRNSLPEAVAQDLFSAPLHEPRLGKYFEQNYAAIYEVLWRRTASDSPQFSQAKERIRENIRERKKQAGVENPEVSDEEVQKEFEKVTYRRIYFAMNVWEVKRQLMDELKSKYTIEHLDPWYRFQSLYKTGKMEDADEVLKEVRTKYPDHLDVLYFSCVVGERLYNRSIRKTQGSTEGEKSPEDVHKAAMEEMKKRCEEMIKVYDEGGYSDPWVLLQYARIAMMTGRMDEARKRLIEAFDNAGKDGMLMMNIQWQFGALGDKEWEEKVKKRREEIQKEMQEEARRFQVLRQ
ncbi:MAG: peptidylprolyl isomerase [bacterium JZ-2024 1]